MAIRISTVSKLDGIKSWSLEARTTCPGATRFNPETQTQDLVPVCAGCYAVGGNYRFPNVKAPRLENQQDWKRPEWVTDMVAALESEQYFRWFDSGDMYDTRLAWKIYDVIRLTPNTQHWLPTRMHKFIKFADVLNEIGFLPNVALRFSSDDIGEFDPTMHGSVVYDPSKGVPAGTTPCRAYENGGKCSGCRLCFSPLRQTIAYPAHGRVMLAQIRKAA